MIMTNHSHHSHTHTSPNPSVTATSSQPPPIAQNSHGSECSSSLCSNSSNSSSSSSSSSSSCEQQIRSNTNTPNKPDSTCQTATVAASTTATAAVAAIIPTKLYVTNFPFTCTQRQIAELFSRFGQVVECTLKKDYYAYILYAGARGAQQAFKNANGLRLMGRKLTVHLATSKKSQSHLNHPTPTTNESSSSISPSPQDIQQIDQPIDSINPTGTTTTPPNPTDLINSVTSTAKIIHVRNFPETCSQQQIRDCFLAYGEIVECLILHDSYAFVHFKLAQDARLALQSTNNTQFMSQNLLVQFSRSKFKQQSTSAHVPTNTTQQGHTHMNQNMTHNPTYPTFEDSNVNNAYYHNNAALNYKRNYNYDHQNHPEGIYHQHHLNNYSSNMQNRKMSSISNKYPTKSTNNINNVPNGHHAARSLSIDNSKSRNNNLNLVKKVMPNTANTGPIRNYKVALGLNLNQKSVNGHKMNSDMNESDNGNHQVNGGDSYEDNNLENDYDYRNETDEIGNQHHNHHNHQHYHNHYNYNPHHHNHHQQNHHHQQHHHNHHNKSTLPNQSNYYNINNENDYLDECENDANNNDQEYYYDTQKYHHNHHYNYYNNRSYNNNNNNVHESTESSSTSQTNINPTPVTEKVRTKLYVTNFPEEMDQDEMKKLFNLYGDVLECTIMWNQYAFVHFGSYEEAEKAINGIKANQCKTGSTKLSVQWSTSSKYQQPKQQNVTKMPISQVATTTVTANDNSNSSSSSSSSSGSSSSITVTKILERRPNKSPPLPNNQSWASIMNNTSPSSTPTVAANDANKTILSKPVTTASNKISTSSAFKISFSEIVRSSATSSQINPIVNGNSTTVTTTITTNMINANNNKSVIPQLMATQALPVQTNKTVSNNKTQISNIKGSSSSINSKPNQVEQQSTKLATTNPSQKKIPIIKCESNNTVLAESSSSNNVIEIPMVTQVPTSKSPLLSNNKIIVGASRKCNNGFQQQHQLQHQQQQPPLVILNNLNINSNGASGSNLISSNLVLTNVHQPLQPIQQQHPMPPPIYNQVQNYNYSSDLFNYNPNIATQTNVIGTSITNAFNNNINNTSSSSNRSNPSVSSVQQQQQRTSVPNPFVSQQQRQQIILPHQQQSRNLMTLLPHNLQPMPPPMLDHTQSQYQYNNQQQFNPNITQLNPTAAYHHYNQNVDGNVAQTNGVMPTFNQLNQQQQQQHQIDMNSEYYNNLQQQQHQNNQHLNHHHGIYQQQQQHHMQQYQPMYHQQQHQHHIQQQHNYHQQMQQQQHHQMWNLPPHDVLSSTTSNTANSNFQNPSDNGIGQIDQMYNQMSNQHQQQPPRYIQQQQLLPNPYYMQQQQQIPHSIMPHLQQHHHQPQPQQQQQYKIPTQSISNHPNQYSQSPPAPKSTRPQSIDISNQSVTTTITTSQSSSSSIATPLLITESKAQISSPAQMNDSTEIQQVASALANLTVVPDVVAAVPDVVTSRSASPSSLNQDSDVIGNTGIEVDFHVACVSPPVQTIKADSPIILNGSITQQISTKTIPIVTSNTTDTTTTTSNGGVVGSGAVLLTNTIATTTSTIPATTNNAFNNYNSYVLFPSDSFDISSQQLEEQSSQQLQQQNSNYYPIEDVLANLIR